MGIFKKIILTVVVLGSTMLVAGDVGDKAKEVPPESIIAPINEKNFSWGYYLGIGATQTYLDEKNSNKKSNRTAGTIVSGLVINQYAGFEGRYTRSCVESSETSPEITSFSFLLKLKAGMEIIDPYLLVGYGFSEIGDVPSVGKEDDDSIQYGLGVQYKITNSSSLFMDYLRVSDNIEVGDFNEKDLGEATIGFTYQF